MSVRYASIIFFISACGTPPYPDYWDDEGAAPEITSVDPDSLTSLAGGDILIIGGARLSSAKTVVIGGRNATIEDVAETELTVTLPDGPPGGGVVDVTVVTDDGYAVAEGILAYDTEGADFWADEVASATLYRLDCPIEIWTKDTSKDWAELFWCGFEMGYAEAFAFYGAGSQKGLAGDQMGFAELSSLPSAGDVRLIAPGDRLPPTAPILYGARAEDEHFEITTARDFARDLAYIEDVSDRIEYFYEWADSVTSIDGMAYVYGADECFAADVVLLDGSGESLTVDGDVSGATGVWLGFAVTEEYGGGFGGSSETYVTEAFTGSASVSADGSELTGEPSGVTLSYDGYSGYFFYDGVGGYIYPSDLPTGATYDVRYKRLGELSETTEVDGVEELELVYPELLSGSLQYDPYDTADGPDDVLVRRDEDLVVEWTPGEDGGEEDDPSFVVIDLRVYDASLDDPLWMTEVARIVGHGVDREGRLMIPSELLEQLPRVDNAVDDNYDLVGLWAELTVARHQLRKAPLDDSGERDLVIDFVHAVNGPITLY